MADNPSSAICPVVRVILYPGSPGERFGLLPCSHRRSGRVGDLVEDGRASWRWITLRKGDAILFDPRLIHAGAIVTRPKPMIVLTYGSDGPHALQTYFHARIRTRQLGFPDPSPALIDLLESENLDVPRRTGTTSPDSGTPRPSLSAILRDLRLSGPLGLAPAWWGAWGRRRRDR